MPSVSKIGKVPPGLRVKFDINGSSNSKRSPAPVNVNGKVDMFSNQPLLTNGHATNSVSLENGKKDHSSSLPTRNGFDKNKIGVANNTKRNDSTVTNGHTNIQTVDTHSVKLDPPEDIDRSKVITVRGPDNFKQESNGVVNKTKILGNKRKVQEAPCILLANDSQSRARVEEMRDILGKEVKSVLSSCGWTDKFMPCHGIAILHKLPIAVGKKSAIAAAKTDITKWTSGEIGLVGEDVGITGENE
ncbi:ubiquitin carboxyl-terminal hydrolase 25-like protein [Trifolium pratense]|uniref:Ubiquitin carboxyl-terminal hydrolase 25-like protein n=2 Tax=Trifolium pratense TaxID=57577 RepID=A0A2K3N9S2_TRIPR|nr:ubiquitin carboxyl-terminal hydrolase 25-like protein [Trifolium pratense]